MINSVIHGDCLEEMKRIPDKSLDMILCDLPYGTTACKWDSVIPFEPLWEQYKRIVKPSAAIVLTASQPFTSQLVMSNPKWFKYEWIWEKTRPSGFFDAHKKPLKYHENVCVFYSSLPTYNPQKTIADELRRGKTPSTKNLDYTSVYSSSAAYKNKVLWKETGERFPKSVIKFSNWNGVIFGNAVNSTTHPTQKPVDLFEYLIKTYTNEGDLILDNCAGSGTTAIAAINTNRNYILIEKELEYFELSLERIAKHSSKDYSVIPDNPTIDKDGQLNLF